MAGTIKALNFRPSFSISPTSSSFYASLLPPKTLFPKSHFQTSTISFNSIIHLPPRLTVSHIRASSSSNSVSILLLTPVFSRLILLLNFQPPEFVTGLAIFTCMPTSLSSGVSVTQLAEGNFALALAMTVISNLLGILVVPFTVSKFVGAGVGISIPTEQLFKSLVITLLIPLILGKVLREAVDGVGKFADNNRKLLSIISAVFLSLVPWIQVSKSRSLLMMVNPTGFLLAIGLGAVLHIVLLVFNALAIKTLSLLSGGKKSIFSNRQNAIAFLLVASQKTLPVTVAVVDQLGGAMGASGLLVLPCVAAHLNQIILDSFLVNFLLKRDQTAHLPKAA